MTIDEFIKVEKVRLDRFERYYKDNHAVHGDEYPLEQEEGEWFDQYMMYDEGE